MTRCIRIKGDGRSTKVKDHWWRVRVPASASGSIPRRRRWSSTRRHRRRVRVRRPAGGSLAQPSDLIGAAIGRIRPATTPTTTIATCFRPIDFSSSAASLQPLRRFIFCFAVAENVQRPNRRSTRRSRPRRVKKKQKRTRRREESGRVGRPSAAYCAARASKQVIRKLGKNSVAAAAAAAAAAVAAAAVYGSSPQLRHRGRARKTERPSA